MSAKVPMGDHSLIVSDSVSARHRRRLRGAAWPLFVLSICALRCGAAAPRTALPRRVAHGMGGIDGNVQTNSLEAFLASYAKGCRLFETDLWVTSDHKLVAFHGPSDPRSAPTFSHDEFMSRRVLGRYTPLDSDGIARLMDEKRDWKLVTDTKTELKETLEILCRSLEKRKVSCPDRVIPQIYGSSSDRQAVEKMSFPEVIFTIYRTSFGEAEIARVARSDRRIVAVTMPPARATPSLVAALGRAGVRCYVHTVNGPEAIRSVFDRGIWGVYTDSNCAEVP